jgi:hypothetical protein
MLPGLREFKLRQSGSEGNTEIVNARLRECVCVVHCSLRWQAPDEFRQLDRSHFNVTVRSITKGSVMDERMASSANASARLRPKKSSCGRTAKRRNRAARRIEEKGYVGHIRFSRIFVLRAASFRREDARLNRS